MDYNYNPSPYSAQPAISQSTYAARTFGWMFLGLLLTFAVSVGMVLSGRVYLLLRNSVYLLLALVEVVVVMVLSARIHKLSVSNARWLFFLYAVLNGMTMSSLLLVYGLGTLIYVFGMTSLYFGIMAAYAWFTKADLSYIRPVLVGGLVVMGIFWLVSLLTGFGAGSRLMCMVGAALFVGFTAYDTQMIRANYNYYAGNAELLEKASIISALQLYLDFINLFLYLLRLFGGKSRK